MTKEIREANAYKAQTILETEIVNLLSKYDHAWAADEFLVDCKQMAPADVTSYNNLFDARDLISQIARGSI